MLKYVDAVSTRAADARRLSPESPLKSRADSWWNCRSTRSTGTLLGVEIFTDPPGTTKLMERTDDSPLLNDEEQTFFHQYVAKVLYLATHMHGELSF